jgi:hypothetical protein
VRFYRCKVYRISTNSSEVLHKLYSEGKFDFWKRPTPLGTADVMVEEGEEEAAFLQAFQQQPHSTNISLLIPNVHELLELEANVGNKFKSGGAVVTWDSYQSLQTVQIILYENPLLFVRPQKSFISNLFNF